MRTRHLVAGSLLLGLLGTQAGVAQEVAAGDCRPSWSTFPMLGISEVSCDCSVEARGARTLWTFRGEPVIEAVAGGGPAAGKLRAGDVLVAINGSLITTGAARELMSALRPGQPVTLTIRRGDRTLDVRVTPEEACEPLSRAAVAPRVAGRPSPAAEIATPVPPRGAAPVRPAPAAAEPPSGPPPVLSTAWFGFGISCTECGRSLQNQREIERLAQQVSELESGSAADPRLSGLRARLDSLRKSVGWHFSQYPRVYSVDPQSPADRAGLERGDLLVAVDGFSLLTEEGGRRFETARPGQTVTWTVQRNNQTRSIQMTAGRRPQPPAAVLARSADRLAESERIRAAELAQLDRLRTELVERARAPADAEVMEVIERQRALVESRAAVAADLAELESARALTERALAATTAPPRPGAPPRSLSPELALAQHLRFAGSVGGAEVEVRGLSSVEVTHDEETGELLIRTADATIRIKTVRR